MTSKETLEKMSFYVSEELNKDDFIECYETIEKDLDRLEQYEKALNELALRKPVMNPHFEPECGGNNINDYINAITDYILELSSIDNIIISAVYERIKRENEKAKTKRI